MTNASWAALHDQGLTIGGGRRRATSRREQILALVRANPDGITTGQIAERIGWPLKLTSCHVSKLHAYGFVAVARWTPAAGGYPVRVWRPCPVPPMPAPRPVRAEVGTALSASEAAK